MKKKIGSAFAIVGIAAAVTFGIAAPSNAATVTGYAIGGKTALATQTKTVFSNSEPVIIHAPSMASSEGCPDPDDTDDGVSVTMVHSDGTEYNCQTGDYTIK